MAFKQLNVFLILISFCSVSYGGFGEGGCTSQGVWTNNALGGLNELRLVVEKLKNDPKCDRLSKSLAGTLEATQAALAKLAQDNSARQTSILNIPKELGALKGLYSQSRKDNPSSIGAFQKVILNMMAAKAVQYTGETSKVSEGDDKNDNSRKLHLDTLSDRLREATDTSLLAMMSFIEDLPANKECVYGNTGGSAMFGGVINVMAAFASAGPNSVGPRMAATVNKLAVYLKENRFSSAVQQLNTAEFQSSMSCLIESSTEAYCTARDAAYALRRGRNILQEQQLNNADNPLNGYFVLSHALPIVTDWLLKVQVGVNPRTVQDANFKKGVMMNVQNFFNSVFDLQGKLSEKIQTIKGYKDDASDTKHNDTKAIATVGLILDLAAEMQSGATSMNFFLQGRQALMLPFEIAGKTKDLPESVFSTDGKVARILTPEAWFGTTDGLAAVKELIGNDSNGYLEKIANNVDKIVKDSTRNAISYYGTWFIVDTGHLVSESVTGVNYSVRDSLALIYKYLDGLIKRADGDSSMGVLMSNVADTMRRIQKILIEYDKADYLYKNEVKPFLAALVNENRKRYRLNKSSPAYFSFLGGVKGSCRPNDSSCTLETQLSDTNLSAMFNKVADYNTKIVTTVYDELNVLLSRSSFLSNRLAVFVEADFLSQIRNNKDISLFEKDFYTATGVAEYELLMSSFNKNPDAAKQDLAQALVLHKQTLLALETLFKNSMVQHIARLRRQSNNLSVSPNAMTIDSARRLLNDVDPAADNPVATAAQRQILAKERYSINPVTGAIRLFETGAMGLVKKMTQSDRYEMDPELPIYERPVGVTDELSSHKTIYQKLCVQALAFIDQAIFRNLCSDVVLKSVLTSKQKTHADPKVRTYLERTAVSWLEKQREGSENRQIVQAGKFAAYNHSIRVCAYRDFLRNSKVLSLTSGQNITRYDPRKTKQIDEMINTIIEADRASEAAEVQRRQNAEAEPTTPEAYEAEQPQTLQPPKPRSALPRPAGKE